ncbi:MAG TPA: DUF4186 domain-containing protein [Allosphingosinicella sp.]
MPAAFRRARSAEAAASVRKRTPACPPPDRSRNGSPPGDVSLAPGNSGKRHPLKPLDSIFAGLARSRFRSRFRLGPRERAYLAAKGPETIRAHAADFIAARLAPAEPANDGRQTPMRGHPIFIAQHATATCCRACLAKWHNIPAGRALTPAEQQHVLAALDRWLAAQPAPEPLGEPPAGTTRPALG